MSRYATPPRKDRVAGAPAAADFLHGTLDTLILKTLAGGPMHGYAIGKWIEDATGAAIELEEGTLYPALYRLEKRGCSTRNGAPPSWDAAPSSIG